ncbi:exonuclease domain-containing protein [Haoranjiania flava]|uniref:Exonuclease domain-containing protein n=1 Tax=Haoranjiania flava TaxID=1856322 RepID=A0AAE3IK90_9BACT|nr:exonuclease domain-containing protein [Haoranjiania flava]MCU7693655.1 exonuclease domain-containing protein [Haoranjiania flava]
MEYAIVDIETTGGYAAGSGITEIAILIHNGESIVGKYETLINPQRRIPRYIEALTGISDEMVEDAPAFEDVAAKIFNLLSGRIFVAHNVNFDYSFIKHFLEKSGYNYTAPKLCTVRMARKIFPGMLTYSLGKLCHALNIPVINRHRAGGDAEATAVLFSKLLEGDKDGHISMMLKKGSKEQQLPPYVVKEDFDKLPSSPGIYYFKDRRGKIIYIGKAKNLRKRVLSHFTGTNPQAQRQHFLRYIHRIDFEVCSTELMALILEAVEIQRVWPQYNRAIKRFEPKYGLFLYEDLNGFARLAIGKFNKSHIPVQIFSNRVQAYNRLHYLVKKFGLCYELCFMGSCDNCRDAKCKKHSQELYNKVVMQAVASLTHEAPSYCIIENGRSNDEYSCILVDKGIFFGMGYISAHNDNVSFEDIKQQLKNYPSTDYIMCLIDKHREGCDKARIIHKHEQPLSADND